MAKKVNKKKINVPVNTDLWLTVKRDIELKIISGEYKAGDKLPTIIELSEMYCIGRTTTQKVMESLSDDGTIVKRMSVGCFVKPYVQALLIDKYKNQLFALLKEVAEYSRRLNVDDVQLLGMMQKALNDVK
ncbi:putative GntR family transcriptional regulator (plasmid) [Oscillibacter valericigenes Sjm18-20]|nr:putative GntR family transcriptional regulator [Oscillibacter valericigenes Sjm18-20]